MRKLLALLILLAAAAIPAAAQTTTVSSTGITDANSIVYNGGTYSITLVNTTGQTPYFQGSPLPQGLQAFNGTLSSAGAFSLSIPSTAFILAGNNGPASLMTWNFSICAQFRSGCFNTNIAVSGATQDVTATLNAASPTMTFALPPNWPPAATGDCPQANGSLMQWKTSCGSSSGVTAVSGTTNQIDVATGTTTPVISLDPAVDVCLGGLAKTFNGIGYSVCYTGTTLDVRVKACLTDAATQINGNTSGICDSSGEAVTQTIAAGITVPTLTTWILPPVCAWTETITNNAVDVIFQNGYSTIRGTEAQSRCQIIAGASGAHAMYYNGLANGYYRASDFFLYNSAGATMASGFDMYVAQTQDNSSFYNIEVADYGTTNTAILEVGGATSGVFPCCSTEFRDITTYGNNTGPIPLQIAAGSGGNAPDGVFFVGGSFGHPAAGKPNIKCVACRASFTGETYLETNNTDTTTSAVQITGDFASIHFDDLHVNQKAVSSTAVPVSISGAGTMTLTIDNFTTGGSGAFTYPISVVTDTSSTCPASPCLAKSDAKGNMGQYTNQSMWAGTFNAFSGYKVAGSALAFSNIAGTATSAQLPLGTGSAPGAVQCDNTTTTCTAGVISAAVTAATAWSAITASNNSSAGTFELSGAGAASTPTWWLAGLPFAGTGTTSIPYMLLGAGTAPTTWNTAGTYLGFNCNSGFTGNAFDQHLNGGTSLASLSCAGLLTAFGITSTANVTAAASSSFAFNGSTRISNISNGVLEAVNTAGTSFTRFDFGGTTSSFAGLCFSATTITVCDASGGTAGTFNSPSIGAGTPGTGAFTTLTASTSIGAGGKTPVGIGTPTQIYNTAAVTQTASIGATTMIANPAADENYRFSVYVGQLNTGTTCTTAGSVQVNLIYTDPISGSVYTYVVPLDTSGDTALLSAVPLASATITVANVASGVTQFRAKASTNVQFSTTYAAGSCVTGQAYNIYPVLEAQ